VVPQLCEERGSWRAYGATCWARGIAVRPPFPDYGRGLPATGHKPPRGVGQGAAINCGQASVKQLLCFSLTGKQMADDKKASEYNIEGGSVLHLVLALRGGF